MSASLAASAWSNVSPYAFCNGNPIANIDPDGQNPVYNLHGDYLGCTSEGFTGTIYIYSGQNGQDINWSENDCSYYLDPNNGYDLYMLTYDQAEASLTGKELGSFIENTLTNVVSHFNGSLILNDKTFNISNIKGQYIQYTEDAKSNFSTIREHGKNLTEITAHGNTYNSYEGTVENFAASIIVHEWFSHGKYKIGDAFKNHHIAYKNVMSDKLFFPQTTEKYKRFVINMYQQYLNKR